MSFIYSCLIIILLPLIIHSTDRNIDDHDIYFEVLEPFDINYTFQCRIATNFGTKFDHLLENIYLIPTKPLKACSRLANHIELKGNIALIERGDCSFTSKALSAQETGAIGAMIINHEFTEDDDFLIMNEDLTKRHVRIPAMFLRYREGRMILNSIEEHNLNGIRINIPLNLTYNDIWKAHKTRGIYSL